MAIEASQGARIGSYVLVRQLGVGGMAEVWLVRHETSAQLRAMKFLNLQFSGIPEVEARFQSEGESRLVHPNIVRIYEVGQQGGSSFMVMDFIDGRDLEKIMDSRRGPLTIPEAVDIGIQILAGLGFAHSNGIVHRDIKPSNVLVDDDGRAYLMDFGIAKVIRSTRNVTQVNARLGTPDYMSPEQIRSSRDVDGRSDIYSFGCLFYELLTGWPPFDRNTGFESVHDIQTAHVTVAPTPPIERRNGLPAALNEIVLHCLAKAKEDRPQTCEEIIADLDAYRAEAARGKQTNRATVPFEAMPPLPSQPPKSSTGPAKYGEMAVTPPSYATAPPTVPVVPPPLPPPPSYSWPQPAAAAPVAKPEAKPEYKPEGKPEYRPVEFPKPSDTAAKSGYAAQSRSETVLDIPLVAPPAMTSGPVMGLGNAGTSNAAINNSNLYTRPVAVQAAVEKAPAKGKRTLLFAVGSVLLLGALGGGAWAVLHKPEQAPYVDPNKDRKTQVIPTPDPNANGDPNNPGNPNNRNNPNKKVTPTPNQIPNQIPNGPADHNYVPKVVKKPDKVTPPAPPTLASGSFTWSGNITGFAQRKVTIYLTNGGASTGEITNANLPRKPVSIRVQSATPVTVIQPDAGRHYSTFQLLFAGDGPQSATITWTELPPNQSSLPDY